MPNLNRSFVRRTIFAALASLLFASACGGSDDPRVGEDGHVRFRGGGCTGSTALAVGARVSLTLETADGDPLPGDLGVTSEKPSVISAHMGLEPNTVDLMAHSQGESRVAITSDGDDYDALVFTAQPAGEVHSTAEPRVFMGGVVDVVVNDVFGDCGGQEDCRLIGNTFLSWRVEPPEQGALILDFDGTASFRAKAVGMGQIIGQEPTRKKDLVTAPITVLAASDAKGLTAMLTTIPFDPKEKGETISLPGSITKTDAFSIRASATLMDGTTVPLSNRDVNWYVQGDEIAAEAPSNDSGDRFSTVFLITASGKLTILADVSILGLSQTFDIDIK